MDEAGNLKLTKNWLR